MNLGQVKLPAVEPKNDNDVRLDFRRIELNRLALVQVFPDPTSVTASATLTAYSQTIVVTAASNTVLTVPSAAGNLGLRYLVLKNDTTTFMVTIAGFVLGGNSGNSRLAIVSDGSNWKLEFLYDEGTYTATLTGCTTSPTVTVSYVRNGKSLSLNATVLTGTSNSTACTITGMPSHIWPANAKNNLVIGSVVDNGLDHIGLVSISTAGVWSLAFYSAATTLTSTFTNPGTKGISAMSASFTLQ
jgi:hypothetical protein